jgi:hypothetical protein
MALAIAVDIIDDKITLKFQQPPKFSSLIDCMRTGTTNVDRLLFNVVDP